MLWKRPPGSGVREFPELLLLLLVKLCGCDCDGTELLFACGGGDLLRVSFILERGS